jgi:formylmethanofuran dehydrogenase subunit C
VKPFAFRLKEANAQRIDMSPLAPDRLSGLSPAEIGALKLWVAKERVRVDELFELAPGNTDELHIDANGGKLDFIGAQMSRGHITIEGAAGDYLAHGMKGGEIMVLGACGAYAASGLSAGTVVIQGDVGDFLGAARAGEAAGLRGGTVLVKGNAGDRAGDHQRRGTILIEGNVGDYCGSRMKAGTIAVLGNAGKGAGFSMHRGTILLSQPPSAIPATFFDAGECDLTFLTLMIASWKRFNSRFATLDRLRKRVRRYVGDQSCGGKGEILVWV